MDWLGFLPVILRSSTSHPRLNPLLASGRIGVYTAKIELCHQNWMRRRAFDGRSVFTIKLFWCNRTILQIGRISLNCLLSLPKSRLMTLCLPCGKWP